ncbi:MAG: hypothetical protein JXB23_01375 [Candidatus Aminicenantes bacterium]|nr:hypothetical protein [Candidatus Aminicenantes bacterium]
MPKQHNPFVWIGFFLLSAGLGFYLTLFAQAFSFTALHHTFRYSSLLPGTTVCSFLFLFSGWLLLARADERMLSMDRRTALRINLAHFLPFAAFLLTPLLLQRYWTRSDFLIRLRALAVAVFLCFVYLKLTQWVRHGKLRHGLEKILSQLHQYTTRKKIIILFVVAFCIYNLCAFVLVSRGITFSGDEPYYLLTAHSLLKDKDINVANNYKQQDYFAFYEKEKNPRFRLGMYARAGKKGRDYIYPVNLPGISVLVLPCYWLSQFFKGSLLTFILKASLSLWASLLGVQIFLLARDIWKREGTALLVWLLYSFSVPVLFYATHLYSEIPIALFSVYVFRKVRSEQSLKPFHYVFCGFLLSLFCWFGLKYNLLFGPLLCVAVYFLLTTHKARLKVIYLLVFPVLSLTLFYSVIHSLYGSFSPFSVYEGVLTPERLHAFKDAAFSAPLSMRIWSFLDYFLDQRDGLLLYSPLYFFSILGFVEIFRKSKKEFLILLFLTIPYLLNYAFFTHRQGYSPQGRILTPISWVGAIAIGYFLIHNQKKIYSFLFRVFSILGIGIAFLLLMHPDFLYQPTTNEFTNRAGDLFVYLSNMHVFLPNFLPSFIKVNNLGYIPNYAWIAAILLFVGFYARVKRKFEIKAHFHHVFAASVIAIVFVLWCLYPRPSLYPTRTLRYSPQTALGFYLFPMGKGVVIKEKKAEFFLHREGDYRFIFSSRREIEKIGLRFGSEKGTYTTRISLFDLPFFQGNTANEIEEITVPPAIGYPFKRLHLYEINLNLKKATSESMLIDPYYFKIIPVKD